MKLTIALVALGIALLAFPLAAKRVGDRPDHIKIRVVDRFTVTVHRNSFPDPDLMNALLLAAGCGLAVMAALVASSGGGGELQRFFVVTAVGLGALAIEEAFELSETLAYHLGIDPKRTDLAFPLLAAVFLVVYRRILRLSRRAMLLGGFGAAVFLVAVFIDEFPRLARVEDPLESVASLMLLTAYVILSLELLRRGREEAVVA